MRTLFRRCVPASGAGAATPILPIRRDYPEIILPDDGTMPVQAAGTLDALAAAWQEICSAAQFGASPLILYGAAIAYHVGVTQVGAGGALVERTGRVVLAKGAAGAEALLNQAAIFGGAAAAQLSGGSGTPTAIALDEAAVLADLAPMLIPANTRLAFKSAVRDALGNRDVCVHAVAYDSATFALTTPAGFDATAYLNGTAAAAAQIRSDVAGPQCAAAWTNGAWVALNVGGVGPAATDLLVPECIITIDPGSGFGNAAAFDFGTATGAGAKTVQSRAIVGTDGLFIYGTYRFRFPMGPFYVQAGETLYVRTRDTGTGTPHHVYVTLQPI